MNILTIRRITVLVAILAAGNGLAGEDPGKSDLDVEIEHAGSAYKSSYDDVPEFGGPSSVGVELREDDRRKDPLFRFGWLDDALAPWFAFKDRLDRDLGLRFGVNYSALYQAVSESPGDDDAASGIFQLQGSWTILGRKSENSGTLVFKVEHRHRLGTDMTPTALGFGAGSMVPTGTQFNQFDNRSWGVTNLYWQQRLAQGRVSLVVGNVDPTDYLDIYGLINPQTAFLNLAFSTNPAIAAPNQGLGAAVGVMLTDNVYVVGGLSDANGTPTEAGFDTFFDDHEYFTQLEIGWFSSYDRRYFDNIHLTAWHVDARDDAGVEDDWGLALSASWFFEDRYMPFLRAGWSDGEAALMEATVSAGLGVYSEASRDLFGVGLGWGRPSADGLDDQWTAEVFYRLQLAENVAITPDIQLIIDPALNPDEDTIWVFGIRARFTF